MGKEVFDLRGPQADACVLLRDVFISVILLLTWLRFGVKVRTVVAPMCQIRRH